MIFWGNEHCIYTPYSTCRLTFLYIYALHILLIICNISARQKNYLFGIWHHKHQYTANVNSQCIFYIQCMDACRPIWKEWMLINSSQENLYMCAHFYLFWGPQRSRAVPPGYCKPLERCCHMWGHLHLLPPLEPPMCLEENDKLSGTAPLKPQLERHSCCMGISVSYLITQLTRCIFRQSISAVSVTVSTGTCTRTFWAKFNTTL